MLKITENFMTSFMRELVKKMSIMKTQKQKPSAIAQNVLFHLTYEGA